MIDTAELEQAIAYLRSVVAKEFHPRGTHKIAAERVIAGAEAYLAGWRPMETVPRDGSPFWGKVGGDAIRMLWHDEFKAFVSSWNQMCMHSGYTFEDGSTTRNHSPVTHEPEAWMPMPKSPAYQDARKEAGL